MKRAIVAMLCFAAAHAHAQGAIQKCVGADGKVRYQDAPCEHGTTAVGQIQRDRTMPDADSIVRASEERERAERLSKAWAEKMVEYQRQRDIYGAERAEEWWRERLIDMTRGRRP